MVWLPPTDESVGYFLSPSRAGKRTVQRADPTFLRQGEGAGEVEADGFGGIDEDREFGTAGTHLRSEATVGRRLETEVGRGRGKDPEG
jgi:hypothetical protein